jgi:hypothetical protein
MQLLATIVCDATSNLTHHQQIPIVSCNILKANCLKTPQIHDVEMTSPCQRKSDQRVLG